MSTELAIQIAVGLVVVGALSVLTAYLLAVLTRRQKHDWRLRPGYHIGDGRYVIGKPDWTCANCHAQRYIDEPLKGKCP